MGNTLNAVRSCFGVLIVVAGLLAIALAAIALIDPIGSQLANDGAPFGLPPSRWSSAVMLFGFLLATVGGVVVIRWRS